MALVDTLVRHAWHQIGCKCGWVNPVSWDADPQDAERSYAEHVAEVLTETKVAQKVRVKAVAQAREQRHKEEGRKQAEKYAFANRVQEAVDQGHSLRKAMEIAAHPPTAQLDTVRTSDAQVGIAMHAIIRYYDEQGHVTDPASIDYQALRAGIDALSEHPELHSPTRGGDEFAPVPRGTIGVVLSVPELTFLRRALRHLKPESEYEGLDGKLRYSVDELSARIKKGR